MIGAGNVTRNCKGDHAVTARWGDTRALAGKRFNGLVKRIARTVGLILGLTLKFEFFVAAFDVVFQSLFESNPSSSSSLTTSRALRPPMSSGRTSTVGSLPS